MVKGELIMIPMHCIKHENAKGTKSKRKKGVKSQGVKKRWLKSSSHDLKSLACKNSNSLEREKISREVYW